MAEQSQFREVSIGTVAENKLRTSNEIEIWLDEIHPIVDGEVVGGYETDSVSCTNIYGDQQTFTVKTSNTITATWRGDGTNRFTAPDVRRGERVRIYQFGDTDKYFWTVVNTPGETTRKRETVVTLFSNTTDEQDNTPSPENSWYQEVNTHEKLITTQTNKNDGEPFAYTQQINAKEGNVVVVADDIGNYIQMNSTDQHITLETAAGAKIEIIKEDIFINCRNYTVNASGSITTKTPKATHNEDQVVYVGSTFDLKMDKLTYVASKYTIQSSTVDISGGSLIHNGSNVGNTHFHIGNQGKPTSPPK